MALINETKITFLSRSVNEKFARSAVAAFVATLVMKESLLSTLLQYQEEHPEEEEE